jgi:membrane associated rhomboid family serine protease
MALCASVFIFQLLLDDWQRTYLIFHYGLIPARYAFPAEFTEYLERDLVGRALLGESGLPPYDLAPFVSSMFLHGDWMHLLLNLWTLWIFGRSVEDRMRAPRYLGLYLCSGLAAGLVQVITNAASTAPTVGASGAIAGIMGAYLFMYPLARVEVLIPIIFIPVFIQVHAIFYLLIWLWIQLQSGLLSLRIGSAVENVAWWAHIGGFAGGILLLRFFLPKRKRVLRRRPPQARPARDGAPYEGQAYRRPPGAGTPPEDPLDRYRRR